MENLTYEQWQDMANKLKIPHQCYIDGGFTDALLGNTFINSNPANDVVLTEVARGGAEDVHRAVLSARRAFNEGSWSRLAPANRKEVLLRLAGLIRENIPELALLDTLDMGKLITDSSTIDAPGSAHFFQWHAEAIDKVYDEIAPVGSGNLAMVRREPLGVVGAVVPWNFPLDMATWKLAAALATGNSVVLKPAEQSPSSALRLAELATQAGIPSGVFNVVTGLGEEAGQALGRHPDVDCLAFTGSTEVGKLFQIYAGESNMKQVWLETGGKSPNIIFADADLEAAAEMAAFGIFFNQGEVCSANSRLLVHRSKQAEMVERLKEKAESIVPGDPLNPASKMGSMVDAQHTDKVMQYIKSGKASARLVTGGERLTINNSNAYVVPTIFDKVTNDQLIARDEIFGPVLSVLAFDDEAEAIAMANDTQYGLAASLWTNDLQRALRVSERLQAGTVSVNTVDALSAMTPFGGMKQSGNGRDLSLHSFDKYSALKTVWIKYE